jgi:hypothetical protein
MHQADTVTHSEVVTFVRARRLFGRGLGWVDVHLLASAILQRHQVWTADLRFAAVASELGIAHREHGRSDRRRRHEHRRRWHD